MSGDTVVTIIGNLTSDPELRFTPGGQAVAGFTVASTPRRFDKTTSSYVDGETLFMRCSAWRDLGENLAASLTRGTRVVVTGRLMQRSFEDAEKNKRTVVELDVEDVGASLRFAVCKVTRATREAASAELAAAGTTAPF